MNAHKWPSEWVCAWLSDKWGQVGEARSASSGGRGLWHRLGAVGSLTSEPRGQLVGGAGAQRGRARAWTRRWHSPYSAHMPRRVAGVPLKVSGSFFSFLP